MKTKTLKITTDDKISVIEVDVNNIKDLQNAIGGGLVEPVKTQKLWDYFKAPVLMLVDEEGLLKDLPLNFFGSIMYGTLVHGCPIVGDLILVLEVGEQWTGLGDVDSEQWNAYTCRISLPADAIKTLGVTPEDRTVTLEILDGAVLIKKKA